MGLDMFLTRKKYIWSKDRKKLKIRGAGRINTAKVQYIEEEIGYWRKANMIHDWFVRNVQDGIDDCKPYYVSDEQLEELLMVVEQVLKNHSLAPALLPTAQGFFFGSTDYDKYYFQDLRSTRKIIKKALKKPDDEYFYSSSW